MPENFSIEFKNRFVDFLPGDPERKNFCSQVFDTCYSKLASLRLSENAPEGLHIDRIVEHFQIVFYDPRQISVSVRELVV